MAYSGDYLSKATLPLLTLRDTAVVAVSGDGPNICGHLLLYTADAGGLYFHVDELQGYPKFMNAAGYQRYLRESGKTELRRRSVPLSRPADAVKHLTKLLCQEWTWLVLPNNCVAFCEDVIKAGGGTWGSYSNCPVVATADTLQERINGFFRQMNQGISGIYGVPAY